MASFSKYVLEPKVDSTLIISSICRECKTSFSPFFDNAGVCSKMSIIPYKLFQRSQVFVALGNSAAKHFLVSVNVIIVVVFSD